jgi:carbon-monoxide dehydrogenase medium subunit
VIPAGFDYQRAGCVEEALEALADPEAKVLAGGHSLLPMMKLRLARPSVLVDIGALDLRGIVGCGSEVRLGALTSWDEIARTPLARASLAALSECAGAVGDLQVRNRGTIGGGLVHADPASDMPAAIMAFGARLRIRSPAGEREVGADEFFVGPFETAVQGQDLLLEILVPRPGLAAGSAYVSVKDPASGYPLAGAVTVVSWENGGCASCAVAVTGVSARPFRARVVEEGMRAGDIESLEAAAKDALAGVDVMSDISADEPYRRHLAAVVIRRSVDAAVRRARAAGGTEG